MQGYGLPVEVEKDWAFKRSNLSTDRFVVIGCGILKCCCGLKFQREKQHASLCLVRNCDACISKMYEDVEKKVQQSLFEVDQVDITTDWWTSCTTEGYVTITTRLIDKECAMQNFDLQTRVLNLHTGLNIGGWFCDACQEWHTDKSSSYRHSSVPIFPALHTLGTAEGNETEQCWSLGSVRKVLSYFHQSPLATNPLQEKQRLWPPL